MSTRNICQLFGLTFLTPADRMGSTGTIDGIFYALRRRIGDGDGSIDGKIGWHPFRCCPDVRWGHVLTVQNRHIVKAVCIPCSNLVVTTSTSLGLCLIVIFHPTSCLESARMNLAPCVCGGCFVTAFPSDIICRT